MSLGLALLVAGTAGTIAAPAATAQGLEFVVLGQGSFPSLASTWLSTLNNVFTNRF
ncbi:MAG: hypothetical protein QOI10_3185 [Solirubrobacterales bacterium]|nr:hypothetical protein [Solirubrobacterales bacterium]